MAHITADRVRETSTSTGTGALTLAGAVAGFRTFGSVMANADTAFYVVANRDAAEWEVGLGTWNTGGTLSRTTVLSSSNAGALVNFSAGTKDVHLTLPAERAVQVGADLAAALPLVASVPAAPPAGFLKVFAQARAARVLPSFMGPSGLDSPLQPAIFANRVGLVTPNRTTTVNFFGCGGQTATTLSHPGVGTGSMAESLYRTRFQTSTTAGNASGVRTDQQVVRGNGGTQRGGFYFAGRMCTGSIALAGCQMLFGLRGSNAALSGEPSAATHLLAIGKDIADTNLQFMRNDGSGTATKVDLGIAYAANVALNIRVFCPPSSSEIWVLVERINNDGTVTVLLDTSYTTDIPATTTALAMHCQVRNGSTAAAANVEMVQMYAESDF